MLPSTVPLAPPKKGLLLVVDDDADIRETLTEVLEDEGYAVVTARHGQHALDRLREGLEPMAILLDLMMPIMDGLAFCSAQRSDAALAGIPVIVISAGGGCEDLASSVGAAGCVKKPIDLEELFAALGRV